MGKRGPKSKLDERLVSQLAKWTEVYGDELLARHKCKIPRSTFHYWKEKGLKQKSGIYRKMLDDMTDAMDAWEARQVVGIEQAKGWQGRAWLLRNRLPEKYSETTKLEHTGKGGTPLPDGPRTVIYLPDNGRIPEGNGE